jgi:ABC-type nitrate/sulfonate/bicarbonate transport system permease component
MGWLLDQVLLTLNVLAIGLVIGAAYSGFGMGPRSYAIWSDRAPWLPRLMGALFAVAGAVPILAIYWLGYRWTGFPSWMRWLVG